MPVYYGTDIHTLDRKGLIKMKGIHGGDIYRNRVKMDFSVNVNPLGIPEAVKKALNEAVEHSSQYPDISAEKLKKNIIEIYFLQYS